MTSAILEDLPARWRIVPLKHLTSSLRRGTAPIYADDAPIRVLGQRANQESGFDWNQTRFHDFHGNPESLKGFLQTDDLVINSTGTGTLGRVGHFSRAPDTLPCIADSHLTIIRTIQETLLARFGFYWLKSQPFQEFMLSAMTVGSTNQIELSRESLGDSLVPLPPMKEQRRIADFLDAEIFRIDKAVELRRKQIELIDERAAARVFSAVRGDSIAGPRKESNLDWLGDVPQSWRIAAVSHYFEVELGKMLNEERALGDNLRPYLRVANVQWDEITLSELAYMDFPPAERPRYRIESGDLLVNEGGSWPGRAAIWNGDIFEMYYQKALHRIRPRGQERARWLYYCLVAAERMKVFLVQGNTSTITHLTREQLRPQRFPFPDPTTQELLVAELDRASEHNAMLKSKFSRQLSLLAERRQALITAAVTGQFDVSTASGRGIED